MEWKRVLLYYNPSSNIVKSLEAFAFNERNNQLFFINGKLELVLLRYFMGRIEADYTATKFLTLQPLQGLTNMINSGEESQNRVKDIMLTKKSLGYHRYTTVFSRQHRLAELRNSWCPCTPRPSKSLSCSKWTKELRSWRKLIHNWSNLDEAIYVAVVNNPDVLVHYTPSSIQNLLGSLEQGERHVVSATSSCTKNSLDGFLASDEIALRLTLPTANSSVETIEISDEVFEKIKAKKSIHAIKYLRPVFFVPKHFKKSTFSERINILPEQQLELAIQNLHASADWSENLLYLDNHFKTIYDIKVVESISSEGSSSANAGLRNVTETEHIRDTPDLLKYDCIKKAITIPPSVEPAMQSWLSSYLQTQRQKAAELILLLRKQNLRNIQVSKIPLDTVVLKLT
ncbi:hypothetical protein IE077_000780 [Cardiosporidium cionae]|uniref:Histone RNA hairpin-binding protein RNA-binding domain-containing protein n=1 Tax=Cardiosporidium cionae TaxID=476202 RepID=A0ABQ7J6H9_9APIC|nr:hypothetical protein IE077_000780 [Cardiosporidium cionae]|eukprot:KAF8819597.1 hypothetical protein IE077_000780 [Cardiosporidium cionae]